MRTINPIMHIFVATLLNTNTCAAEVTIHIFGGQPIEIQSTDVAEITYVSQIGDLVLPPHLSFASKPVFQSLTGYQTTTKPIGHQRIADISAALTFILFTSTTGMTPDVTYDFAVGGERYYDALLDNSFTSTLTHYLNTRTNNWRDTFHDSAHNKLIDIRESIPLSRFIDDETLTTLITEQIMPVSTPRSASIPLSPSGIIGIPPNSPNGTDHVFHVIAPPVSQDSLGNGVFPFSAENVCQPFLSYWEQVSTTHSLSDRDIEYLQSLSMPLSAETFLETARNDCLLLESNIETYRRYVAASHNIMRAMPTFYDRAESFEEVHLLIRAEIERLNFVDGGPLGADLQASLYSNATLMASIYNLFADRQLPGNIDQIERTPVSTYWEVHNAERDTIQQFLFLSTLSRPIIRSNLFSVYISFSDESFAQFISGLQGLAPNFGQSSNRYKQRISLRLADLSLTLQGLESPLMLEIGRFRGDATYAAVVQQISLLRQANELANHQDILALLTDLMETHTGLTGLNRFHRITPGGSSSIWPDLPGVVQLINAPAGATVRPGQTVATIVSTQTYIAELNVGRDVRGIGPGSQLRVRLSAPATIPSAFDFSEGPTAAPMLSCLTVTNGQRLAVLGQLGDLVQQRSFLLSVGSQIGYSEINSTRTFSAQVELEDPSFFASTDAELLRVAQCSGLSLIVVNGEVGVRADWGVLLSGQRYDVTIVPH